jgi:hexosaminidase
VITLEDIYRFNPMPDALSVDMQRHILGVQVNLWTEHMRTEERVQWMAVPRAAALAEIGWSRPERLDFPGFRARLESATGWYRALGYGYADTEFRAPAPIPARSRRSQQLKTCSDKLVLNLEDDAPVHGERAVFLVDIMEPCWIFEDADLTGITSVAATVGQFPFNFQIGKDRDAIRLREPRSAEGELEIRLDGCDGEPIAVFPLASAVGQAGVTRLPAASFAARTGQHDLCLQFTGHSIDPMWAIDSIELVE